MLVEALLNPQFTGYLMSNIFEEDEIQDIVVLRSIIKKQRALLLQLKVMTKSTIMIADIFAKETCEQRQEEIISLKERKMEILR
jgi:hypothetical protein